MLTVTYREIDDVSVLDLYGAIDLDAQDLINELASKESIHPKANQLWNLKDVKSISSSGIGILLNALMEVKSQGRVAKLAGAVPELLDGFRLHKVLPAFDIHPDEESAIKQIKVEMDEKAEDYIRLFDRVNVGLKAKYKKYVEQGNGAAPQKSRSAETKCLSRSGIFLQTEKTFEPDTLIEVTLKLPKGFIKPHVDFVGKVVWVADEIKQPQMYPGMALCTLFMEDAERKKLEDFLSAQGI